jgi:RNA-binding protein
LNEGKRGKLPRVADPLTAKQRAHLRGLAHHLDPVVHIGRDGITEAVVRQIDEQLAHHELIKVKLGEGAPLDRDEAAARLPAAVGAQLVQNIGRLFVLYRAHPDDPQIVLPKAKPA